MILPVFAYGHPILRKKCKTISRDYPDLDTLIENMFDTMYSANGVGLAGPQIGFSLRIFVVDATPFLKSDKLSEDEIKAYKDFKKVFINPTIVEENGETWAYNEGCLSIPGVYEDVSRPKNIIIEYLDRDFRCHREEFTGLFARVVQHEYDHIEGVLFTDKISAFHKKIISGRLDKIRKGQINTDYPMKFHKI